MMNKELLTSLSNEAYKYAVDLHGRMEDNPECADAYEEKLVELVVRECAEIADEAFVKQMGHMKPGRFVKEHFEITNE
jgi:hypothetical protein